MLTRKQKNKEKAHLSKINREYRRTFFRDLEKICNLFAGYDMYALLPPHELESIYEHRIRGIKIVNGNGDLNKKEITLIERVVMGARNQFFIPNKHGEPIPLGMYMIEGLSFVCAATSYKEHEFEGAKEVNEVIKKYDQHSPFFRDFILTLNQMLYVLSLFIGDYNKDLTYAKFSLELWQDTGRLANIIKCYKVAPEIKYFVIDNKPRPALRVSWAFPLEALLNLEMKPSQLGIVDDNDLPMQVYIQSHALKRLEERIGCQTGLLHSLVYDNMKNAKQPVHQNGKILIDYYYMNQMAGYLVCSIIDNAVFVHTFLFLTHNGTPEGKRLTELTGFQKNDVKYFAIDKLSSFLSYNIQDDDFAKEVFIEAGCGPLFKLAVLDKSLPTQSKSDVGVLVKYLMANYNHKALMEQ